MFHMGFHIIILQFIPVTTYNRIYDVMFCLLGNMEKLKQTFYNLNWCRLTINIRTTCRLFGKNLSRLFKNILRFDFNIINFTLNRNATPTKWLMIYTIYIFQRFVYIIIFTCFIICQYIYNSLNVEECFSDVDNEYSIIPWWRSIIPCWRSIYRVAI